MSQFNEAPFYYLQSISPPQIKQSLPLLFRPLLTCGMLQHRRLAGEDLKGGKEEEEEEEGEGTTRRRKRIGILVVVNKVMMMKNEGFFPLSLKIKTFSSFLSLFLLVRPTDNTLLCSVLMGLQLLLRIRMTGKQ